MWLLGVGKAGLHDGVVLGAPKTRGRCRHCTALRPLLGGLCRDGQCMHAASQLGLQRVVNQPVPLRGIITVDAVWCDVRGDLEWRQVGKLGRHDDDFEMRFAACCCRAYIGVDDVDF